eukprot:7349248-Pyramimonas_sp.AAC.1
MPTGSNSDQRRMCWGELHLTGPSLAPRLTAQGARGVLPPRRAGRLRPLTLSSGACLASPAPAPRWRHSRT